MNTSSGSQRRFGMAPVFFTAISTILGAILFLRFGFAVGTLGFWGVILIILIGHLVSLPTALAISEIATNQQLESGGEYYIISRSFGLNIGATIGIALYLSQAISVAFYIIAFTEAFEPFFNWVKETYDIILPRQVISIPSLLLLAIIILRKGANIGVKALYVVVTILFIALTCFFLGKTEYSQAAEFSLFKESFTNPGDFFIVFAIVFPSFTGMTAGVGLSGDLKNPKESIPLGTTLATITGMIVYMFITWKLTISASPEDLLNKQLVMSDIAIFGPIIVPLGLAAATISSALGSIMVAPRTLQALSVDRAFPSTKINLSLKKGKGEAKEPFNASVITFIIALVFVVLGDVNVVAKIITMFFMVTYGSLCLISFLNHFGAAPSYRPCFKSKWYFSFIGFIMSVWLMFMINPLYAISAVILMTLLYAGISRYHKGRRGLEVIFQGVIFQVNRFLHVFLQKTKKRISRTAWRPSVVCVSKDSFERPKVRQIMSWIAFKYGFGTYIHLIEGYYSRTSHLESEDILNRLVKESKQEHSHVYLDVLISPSYRSAIAQIIQLPSISGMKNNMIVFEYDKENTVDLEHIVDNFSLVKAGDYDICIFGSSIREIKYDGGIHIWLKSTDFENANFMILLAYIIIGHPDWKKSEIKIFEITEKEKMAETKKKLYELVTIGRLPISAENIKVIQQDEDINPKVLINAKSIDAGLTIIGLRGEQIKHQGEELFQGYEGLGDLLFVNSHKQKEIE